MDTPPLSRPLSEPGTARRIGPFSAVAALAAFLLAFEEDAGTWTFVGAVAAVVGSLVAIAVLPWRRMPAWSESLVPALGMSLTIALLRHASGGTGAGYSAAVLLPIVWVALYGGRTQLLAIYLAVLATWLLPIALRGEPGPEARRALLWATSAGVIGPIIHSLVRELATRQASELAQARVVTATLDAFADPVVRFRAVRGADGRAVDFRREWLNTSAASMVGRKSQSLEDTLLSELGGTTHLVAMLASAIVKRDPTRFEYPMVVAGQERRFEACAVPVGNDRVLCTWHDVTEQRAAFERLAHDAMHDHLTGLPNRRLLTDRLQTALRSRTGTAAVLFVDLDGFKAINDRLGHDAGDDVLVEIGKRLGAALRGGDTIARIGGDEFVVVLPGIPPEGTAELAPIIDRLSRSIHVTIHTRKGDVSVGASIGHVIGRAGDDAEQLIERADRAMYVEKSAARERRPDLRLVEKVEGH